ncbi:MAG TPA: hypothetical protein VI912_03325 [Candidatus Bilamarchaeaceae archaeon]|nr:hypothetical protein [Candidatus Bilamarchaeaceae archaeon]
MKSSNRVVVDKKTKLVVEHKEKKETLFDEFCSCNGQFPDSDFKIAQFVLRFGRG